MQEDKNRIKSILFHLDQIRNEKDLLKSLIIKRLMEDMISDDLLTETIIYLTMEFEKNFPDEDVNQF